MAAVIAPHPRSIPTRRPVAEPVRAPLRVIPGGRQAARAYARQARPVRLVHPAVYRRRRLAVLLVAVLLAVIAYLTVTGLGVVLGAHHAPATSPAAAVAASSAATSGGAAPSATYVVQPGDTLWSIARRLRPSGDIRSLVDALSSRAGGASLQAGQRLSLDGLVD